MKRWRVSGWCAKCTAQGITDDDAITVEAADQLGAVDAALVYLLRRKPDAVNHTERWVVEEVQGVAAG